MVSNRQHIHVLRNPNRQHIHLLPNPKVNTYICSLTLTLTVNTYICSLTVDTCISVCHKNNAIIDSRLGPKCAIQIMTSQVPTQWQMFSHWLVTYQYLTALPTYANPNPIWQPYLCTLTITLLDSPTAYKVIELVIPTNCNWVQFHIYKLHCSRIQLSVVVYCGWMDILWVIVRIRVRVRIRTSPNPNLIHN